MQDGSEYEIRAAGRANIVGPGKPMPDGYSPELACDVTTRLGTVMHIRPIRPDDAPRLVAFHQHLSPRSVYRRYFSLRPSLSDAEVDHFTCVDYVDRMAFITEDEGRLVAVGRYEGIPGTSEAEVAFVVADEYQHLGIGTLLLEQLAEVGWRNGIRTFVANTLMDNRDMLAVFENSGFHVSTNLESGIVDVRFPIEPDEVYLKARAAHRTRSLDPYSLTAY